METRDKTVILPQRLWILELLAHKSSGRSSSSNRVVIVIVVVVGSIVGRVKMRLHQTRRLVSSSANCNKSSFHPASQTETIYVARVSFGSRPIPGMLPLLCYKDSLSLVHAHANSRQSTILMLLLYCDVRIVLLCIYTAQFSVSVFSCIGITSIQCESKVRG